MDRVSVCSSCLLDALKLISHIAQLTTGKMDEIAWKLLPYHPYSLQIWPPKWEFLHKCGSQNGIVIGSLKHSTNLIV